MGHRRGAGPDGAEAHGSAKHRCLVDGTEDEHGFHIHEQRGHVADDAAVVVADHDRIAAAVGRLHVADGEARSGYAGDVDRWGKIDSVEEPAVTQGRVTDSSDAERCFDRRSAEDDRPIGRLLGDDRMHQDREVRRGADQRTNVIGNYHRVVAVATGLGEGQRVARIGGIGDDVAVEPPLVTNGRGTRRAHGEDDIGGVRENGPALRLRENGRRDEHGQERIGAEHGTAGVEDSHAVVAIGERWRAEGQARVGRAGNVDAIAPPLVTQPGPGRCNGEGDGRKSDHRGRGRLDGDGGRRASPGIISGRGDSCPPVDRVIGVLRQGDSLDGRASAVGTGGPRGTIAELHFIHEDGRHDAGRIRRVGFAQPDDVGRVGQLARVRTEDRHTGRESVALAEGGQLDHVGRVEAHHEEPPAGREGRVRWKIVVDATTKMPAVRGEGSGEERHVAGSNVAQFEELIVLVILAASQIGRVIHDFGNDHGPNLWTGVVRVQRQRRLSDEMFLAQACHIASERDAIFGGAKAVTVHVAGEVGAVAAEEIDFIAVRAEGKTRK